MRMSRQPIKIYKEPDRLSLIDALVNTPAQPFGRFHALIAPEPDQNKT